MLFEDCSKIQYETRVVGFIDILGFKEKIKTNEASEICNIFKRFQDFDVKNIEQKGHKWVKKEVDVVFFSDSILFSFPLENTNDKSILSLLELQEICIDLAEDGVLLRGAITVGDFVHKNNMLFGPALITAYEIERDKALYPRIVMDKKTFCLIRQNEKVIGSSKTSEEVLKLDFDGWYFIDYINYYQNTDKLSHLQKKMISAKEKYIFIGTNF